MSELTSHGFEHGVRETLRYQHGFDHGKLEQASGIFHDTLTELKKSSLGASHFDKAFEAMQEHKDWGRLNERQQGALVSTLKGHLGITEH